jgi:Gti1/Pac2 family
MIYQRNYDDREVLSARSTLPPPPPPLHHLHSSHHSHRIMNSPPSSYEVRGARVPYHHPNRSPPSINAPSGYGMPPTSHHPRYNYHSPPTEYERFDEVQRSNYHHREYMNEHAPRPYTYGEPPMREMGGYPGNDHGAMMAKQEGMHNMMNGYPTAPHPAMEHRRSVGMLNAPPPHMMQPNAYNPHSIHNDGHYLADPNMIHMGSPGDQRPTYIGYIKSAHDAILLLSACDLPSDASSPKSPQNTQLQSKTIPPPRRVTRRLLDAERADMVSSGCVFAWDEKEAGMKRWTDGRVWSASRVSGCFLTYRELEARKKSNNATHDGPTSNQYKPEGLIKQSFSITTASGRKLHVISYFTKRDVREGRLRRVSEDPRFVGEGGGEWGLKVNDEEYSFHDGINRAGGLPDGQGDADILDEDDEDDVLDSPISRPATTLPINVSNTHQTQFAEPTPVRDEVERLAPSEPVSVQNPRKRSLPDDSDIDPAISVASAQLDRAPMRPKLQRLRSSSYSGTPTGSKPNSYQSGYSSSVATTVPSSDPLDGNSKSLQPLASSHQHTTQYSSIVGRSSAIRALVSPTLPRESAIRGSANEMQASDSQDSANANAVGALLSLAGGSSKSSGPSPLGNNNSKGEVSATVTNGTISGLGLNVKGLPERHESDRNALNMFSVRL